MGDWMSPRPPSGILPTEPNELPLNTLIEHMTMAAIAARAHMARSPYFSTSIMWRSPQKPAILSGGG